jgi:probable HAF family extracellular repeat protein
MLSFNGSSQPGERAFMNTSGSNRIFQSTLILIATCLAAGSANAEPKLRFEIAPIVPDAPHFTVVPTAINNHGVVAGNVDEGRWPFRYHNGVIESVPLYYGGVPLNCGMAIDINDAGEIVVQCYYYYLVRPTETIDTIVLREGDDGPLFHYASALNNRGEVAGGGGVAAIWSNGVVQVIGPPDSDAFDINDAGVAVGATAGVAAMFRDGQSISLGTLPGFAFSYAQAINNRGEVLGTAHPDDDTACYPTIPGCYRQTRAFLLQAGSMIDLGTLPGATAVRARALNNLGHVVGNVEDAEGRQRAFLYMDGVMHDLTEFIKPNTGWTFLTANAINDKDQIAGVGQINGGARTAFLLTPKKQPKPHFHFKPPRGVFPGPGQ